MNMSNTNNLHYVKKLAENRKTLEKGLSPQEKSDLRNKEAGGDAGSKVGARIRGRRAEDAKKYRGVRTKSTGEYAYTRGEVLKDPKRVKSGLAAHLSLYGSPKVKGKASKKWKELNASTEVTYRDGIKALFESVLDELKEGTGYEPEPEGAEDAYNHQARLAAEKDAKKRKQDAIDAEQAHHDSEKGKEAANQLRNLVHGRKGIKLQKPMINMGTSDKLKMKQLDWTQNIRTLFQSILSEEQDTRFHRQSDLLMSVAGAATGDKEHIEALKNHAHGAALLNHYKGVFNRLHKQLKSKGVYHPDANGIAHRHAYESTRKLINYHDLHDESNPFPE